MYLCIYLFINISTLVNISIILYNTGTYLLTYTQKQKNSVYSLVIYIYNLYSYINMPLIKLNLML